MEERFLKYGFQDNMHILVQTLLLPIEWKPGWMAAAQAAMLEHEAEALPLRMT